MKVIYFFSFLSFLSFLNAQFALPSFQAIHITQNTSSSSSNVGPVIGAGYRHSGAILSNGTVKVWGYNNNGHLGQGNTQHIGDNSNEMGDNLPHIDLSSSSDATLE